MLNWSEAQPLLAVVYRLVEDRSTDMLEGAEVAAALGKAKNDQVLYTQLRWLNEAGYLRAHLAGGTTVGLIQPTHLGLQTEAGWPKPGEVNADVLRLLDERIDDPDTSDDDLSALEKLRDAVGATSQTVISGLLLAWAQQHTGLG
jgi:hypothetical protein